MNTVPAMNWYVEEDGVSRGPIPDHELAARVRAREVPADTLVWHPGLEDWRPLGQLCPEWLAPAPMEAPAASAASATMPRTSRRPATKPLAPSGSFEAKEKSKPGLLKRLFGGGNKT